ncbi:hypothetical protein CVT24_003208 [Panaeolus cyanescens]|uniref:Histidine kinase/HSP90-like ATPase domain-containing protein n=1 Tax=Panaeolus cyanescens TaxID=181874 RepID=A0A409VUF0_9AGAR|nr:hypothetical protein CVT24_003208 [Panaeolus cyanescens]
MSQPLPQGWSEHLGPNGQLFYYNLITRESTFIRPAPLSSASATNGPKPKEKPKIKTPIPGTDWLRVTTTEGNVFYSNKITKQSLWTIPEGLESAVKALTAEKAPIKSSAQKGKEKDPAASGKRKAEDTAAESARRKKTKTQDPEEEDDEDSEDSDEEEDAEEEEWQREAAEQLAREAKEEEERKRLEAEQEQKRVEAEQQEAQRLQIPQRVDLSVEEGKALFKTLLREKDINPLHPWDTSLPKFISDPRYVLLSSVAARKEAFDEYCKERARELRQSAVKKEKETSDPKQEFEKLLKEEVKSTRTSWTDFRRQWKKDRRFYGWGRDEREREKRFRDYLKELGEEKKKAAQKAEVDFFALLKEHLSAKQDLPWKEAKKLVYKDPRYDAVGSSSLREELYQTFVKGTSGKSSTETPAEKAKAPEKDADAMEVDEAEDKQKRREKAVKEREAKVIEERQRLEARNEKTKKGMNMEEGERVFMTMLTDAIRDPKMSWDAAVSQLKDDPRFANCPLPINRQVHIFHQHAARLQEKYMESIRKLFATHAPTLATRFSSLPIETILSSLPATQLRLDEDALEHEYHKWLREQTSAARIAFDEMLSENSFVEFWGRLGKIDTKDSTVKIDDEDLGEMEEEKVDMKALAKNVDLREMEKVLKNDKRYIMFDHVPEKREEWLREYLSNLAAPKLPVLVSLFVLSSRVFAEEAGKGSGSRQAYQSDVARLRKIVINSLYSHQEIFLRELISNANDAIEKLRILALTDKSIYDGSQPLNITIKAVKDEDGKGGRLIISDTGIGMSPEELTTNLGTLAKSGTSDFLAKAEGSDKVAQGNLIGAFGLGFYSSFLVADSVEVASVPPKTAKNPNPVQHVFASSADDSTFEVYPDPRGNTIGRGTEITLHLKPEAAEYLDEGSLSALVHKHSAFSTTFPIYLFERWNEEVVDEEATAAAAEAAKKEKEAAASETETKEAEATEEKPEDDDEAIIEEIVKEEEAKEEAEKEAPAPIMKTVTKEQWTHLNGQPPLWARDPKNITDAEYTLFYKSTFKDFEKPPLAWHHFSGDAGDGVAFKGLLFFPSKLSDDFWQKPLDYVSKDVRLMVKRVFITSDLGADALPKWASWVKVVIDADDLPLNVSRETLQSNKFLKQLKGIIVKRMIQLFSKITESDDKEKYNKMHEIYGSVLKLGAAEDIKNRDKLVSLIRYTTNQRNDTSLDQYLENRKKGQKQIFYLSEMGKTHEDLAKSVFIEKLHARGYEVLLLNEPLDEILVGYLREWKGVPFQDAARQGLKFGDEELSPEEEKKQQKELEEKFKPLTDWLKKEVGDAVRNVVLSNRLVQSPVAIVAETGGYTANVQKMMTASNAKSNQGGILHEYALKAKLLEINPHSPLIEGLLRRVNDLPTDEDDRDVEAEDELKEVASILIDGALIRSGFDVADTNSFFTRVDRVLRRSLGVSETAETKVDVKPAPPVASPEDDVEPEADPSASVDSENDGKPGIVLPDELKGKLDIQMEEIDDDGNVVPQHDEL